MGREPKPITSLPRNNREKTITFLGDGDNDIEKYGMEAHIFIHLERLEVCISSGIYGYLRSG